MQNSAQDTYFADQVLTAPPQKLQLMLIEGAIRNALLARRYWSENKPEEAGEALIRSQEIVTELMYVARASGSELARNVVEVYLFIFRRLVEANLRQDDALLGDALRVLEEEQETWQLVCERLAAEAPEQAAELLSSAPRATLPSDDAVSSAPPPPAGLAWNLGASPAPEPVMEGGFSFEA